MRAWRRTMRRSERHARLGEYRMKTAQNLLRRFWLETRAEAPLAADAVNVFACRA
jgi:xanthine dehydrogenase iron-sulfur cluster and FAD-binding subunit A